MKIVETLWLLKVKTYVTFDKFTCHFKATIVTFSQSNFDTISLTQWGGEGKNKIYFKG